MNEIAPWISAAAAIASAIAAWNSLSVARAVAEAGEQSRRSNVLREWRQVAAMVVGEANGCIEALSLLRPSIDASAVLAGAFGGSAHDEILARVDRLKSDVETTLADAISLRDSNMHAVSIGDLESALAKSQQQLASVRMASQQVSAMQIRNDAEISHLRGR
ncbi:MAG: hypothetical protein U1F41_05780 [Burkholderiales bacterium]